MTDRVLLELAAKAAGMAVGYDPGQWFWCKHGPRGHGMYVASRSCVFWNPLQDDGDALRLAVACGIEVGNAQQYRRGLATYCGKEYWEADGDLAAATRRAIVRAAAEIGNAP